MPSVPPNAPPDSLRPALLALQEHDLGVRGELEAQGVLFQGYHPRMEAVHRQNAAELRRLIDAHGWPTEAAAGADGAEAAWLVAQHAIAEPAFMRRCRDLIDECSAAGSIPRWQFAYIDDRIRVSEGRPQRFGTQIKLAADGPQPCPLDDPAGVDARRRALGLPPLRARLEAMAGSPRPTPAAQQAQEAQELAWRRAVGWLAPADAAPESP
jgi:hypothetical protein